MYWDEEEIKPYILQYQEANEEERKRIYEKHLHKPIKDLIIAQINTHKFNRFEPYNDLFSVALEQVLKTLNKKKYDPNYWVENKNRFARTFDYFSLVVKQSMFHYTKKNESRRNRDKNIDDFYHLHSNNNEHYELQWEYYCRFVDKYIDIYFSGRFEKLKNRYIKMWNMIREQDFYFTTMTNREYFKFMRASFPNENNTTMRNLRVFLEEMATFYETGEKPYDIKKYEEREEKKRNNIEYFTVELFNKKIKYKKQNNRITRLEEMSLSEST